MSEQQKPDAPAPEQADPPPQSPQPTDDKADAKKPDDGEPTWLPDRLRREADKTRRDLLSEMGIDDPAIVKQLIEEKKAADEAAKSEQQKRDERIAELAKQAESASDLRESLAKYANSVKASLTDDQRAALEAISDDPQRQLDALPALQKTWAAPAPQSDAPPKTTAPPPDAPGDANPGSPPDPKATWDALRNPEGDSYNPFEAARYLAHNAHRIADS